MFSGGVQIIVILSSWSWCASRFNYFARFEVNHKEHKEHEEMFSGCVQIIVIIPSCVSCVSWFNYFAGLEVDHKDHKGHEVFSFHALCKLFPRGLGVLRGLITLQDSRLTTRNTKDTRFFLFAHCINYFLVVFACFVV